MSAGPAALTFGWPRSWIPSHLRRRLLAALLAALGLLFAASSLRQAQTGVPVLVAAHDLPAGARLTPGDVTSVSLPRSAVPAGSQTSAAALVGRTLTSAMRAREPVTDARLAEASQLLPAGLVAAPVRLADPDVASFLHAGSRVDVIAAVSADDQALSATSAAAPSARIVARDAGVISVADTARSTTTAAGGTLVVLAVSSADALSLAAGEAGGKLSVTLLGG